MPRAAAALRMARRASSRFLRVRLEHCPVNERVNPHRPERDRIAPGLFHDLVLEGGHVSPPPGTGAILARRHGAGSFFGGWAVPTANGMTADMSLPPKPAAVRPGEDVARGRHDRQGGIAAAALDGEPEVLLHQGEAEGDGGGVLVSGTPISPSRRGRGPGPREATPSPDRRRGRASSRGRGPRRRRRGRRRRGGCSRASSPSPVRRRRSGEPSARRRRGPVSAFWSVSGSPPARSRQRPLRRGLNAPGHRDVAEAGSPRLRHRGEAPRGIGGDGREVEPDGARPEAGREAVRARRRLLDRGRVGEHRADDVDPGGGLSRCGDRDRSVSAKRDEPSRACGSRRGAGCPSGGGCAPSGAPWRRGREMRQWSWRDLKIPSVTRRDLTPEEFSCLATIVGGSARHVGGGRPRGLREGLDARPRRTSRRPS